MKPIIGIVVRNDDSNLKYFFLNREVCNAIKICGGIPIGLCQNEDVKPYIDMCDGFVLPGGDYFTEFDLNLIKEISKVNKPLFGICLGMQEMGGKKVKENLIHKSSLKYVHYIKIIPNSKLYKIIKKDNILVNSRHKDYLYETNLKVSAISDDGFIEAIEDNTKDFFVGVQWHPETLIDTDINSKLLFESFIKACKR